MSDLLHRQLGRPTNDRSWLKADLLQTDPLPRAVAVAGRGQPAGGLTRPVP